MTIIGLIIFIVVAGLLLWLVNNYIPMDPKIKQILNILVVVFIAIVAIVFLLNIAGINTGAHLNLT